MSPDKWELFTKVIRFLGREEVKTPLSFAHKVVPYFVLAIVAIVIAPVTDRHKFFFALLVCGFLLLLLLFVAFFAWFRPTHLVYGESSHRAERKWEYGTESRTLEREALDHEETVTNPKLLESEKE